MEDIKKCWKFLSVGQFEQIFVMRIIQQNQQLLNYYYAAIMEVCKQKHKIQQLKQAMQDTMKHFNIQLAQQKHDAAITSFIKLRQIINQIIKAEFRVFICCQKPVSIIGTTYFDQVYFFKQLIGFNVINLTHPQIKTLLSGLELQELYKYVDEIQLNQIQFYFQPSNKLIQQIVQKLSSGEKFLNYDRFKQVIQENEIQIFNLQNKLQEAEQKRCSILLVPTEPNQPFQEYHNAPIERSNNQSIKLFLHSNFNESNRALQQSSYDRVQNSEFVVIDPTFGTTKSNIQEKHDTVVRQQKTKAIYFQQQTRQQNYNQLYQPNNEKSLSDISDIDYSSKISNVYLSEDELSQYYQHKVQLKHKNLEESLISDKDLRRSQQQNINISTEFLNNKGQMQQAKQLSAEQQHQHNVVEQQKEKLQKQLQKLDIPVDPFILQYLIEKSQPEVVNGYVTPRVRHDVNFYNVDQITGEIKQDSKQQNVNYQLTEENQQQLVKKINEISQLKQKHEELEQNIKNLVQDFQKTKSIKIHKQISDTVADLLDNYTKYYDITKLPYDFQFKTNNMYDTILKMLPDNYIEEMVMSQLNDKKLKPKDLSSIQQLRRLSKEQQLGFILNMPSKDQKFSKQDRQLQQSFQKYQKYVQKQIQKQKLGKPKTYKCKYSYDSLQSQYVKQRQIDQKAKQLGLEKVSALPLTSQGQQYYQVKKRSVTHQIDESSSQSKFHQSGEDYNIGRMDESRLNEQFEGEKQTFYDKENINSVVRISTHRPTSALQCNLRAGTDNHIESFDMDKKGTQMSSEQTTETKTESKDIIDLDSDHIVDTQKLNSVINSFNTLSHTLKVAEEEEINPMFDLPLSFSCALQENELSHVFIYRADDKRNDRKFTAPGDTHSNKCKPSIECNEDISDCDLKVWIQSAVYDSNSPYRLFDSSIFNIKSLGELSKRKRHVQLSTDVKNKSYFCCKKVTNQ